MHCKRLRQPLERFSDVLQKIARRLLRVGKCLSEKQMLHAKSTGFVCTQVCCKWWIFTYRSFELCSLPELRLSLLELNLGLHLSGAEFRSSRVSFLA